MATTPNLPSLPDWAACFNTKDRKAIRAYALEAYQAGIDVARAPGHDNNRVQVGFAPSGRDLYNQYLRNRSGYPEWCELDDIEQASWNAKAKEANG